MIILETIMSEFAKTFYNADRSCSATIDYAEINDYDSTFFFDECLKKSCEVFLATDHLSSFFREQADSERYEQVNEAIQEARRVGDQVFFIEIYEHSAYAVRINPNYDPICRFDSGLNGVIIVHAEDWKQNVSDDFSPAFVEREMDMLAESATAWMNGWLYEINSSDCCLRGPFLTTEEAEKELHAEWPDLVFTDDDFDCECVCTYSLKPEVHERLVNPA